MNIYCRAGGRFHKRMEQAIICRHNFVDKIMHARGRRQKYFHYNLVKIVDGEIIFNNLAKSPCSGSKPENILCCFGSFFFLNISRNSSFKNSAGNRWFFHFLIQFKIPVVGKVIKEEFQQLCETQDKYI